jgi:hypothetical protein
MPNPYDGDSSDLATPGVKGANSAHTMISFPRMAIRFSRLSGSSTTSRMGPGLVRRVTLPKEPVPPGRLAFATGWEQRPPCEEGGL